MRQRVVRLDFKDKPNVGFVRKERRGRGGCLRQRQKSLKPNLLFSKVSSLPDQPPNACIIIILILIIIAIVIFMSAIVNTTPYQTLLLSRYIFFFS